MKLRDNNMFQFLPHLTLSPQTVKKHCVQVKTTQITSFRLHYIFEAEALQTHSNVLNQRV